MTLELQCQSSRPMELSSKKGKHISRATHCRRQRTSSVLTANSLAFCIREWDMVREIHLTPINSTAKTNRLLSSISTTYTARERRAQRSKVLQKESKRRTNLNHPAQVMPPLLRLLQAALSPPNRSNSKQLTTHRQNAPTETLHSVITGRRLL